MEASMFCLNCGKKLVKSANFCSECGYRLEQDIDVTSSINGNNILETDFKHASGKLIAEYRNITSKPLFKEKHSHSHFSNFFGEIDLVFTEKLLFCLPSKPQGFLEKIVKQSAGSLTAFGVAGGIAALPLAIIQSSLEQNKSNWDLELIEQLYKCGCAVACTVENISCTCYRISRNIFEAYTSTNTFSKLHLCIVSANFHSISGDFEIALFLDDDDSDSCNWVQLLEHANITTNIKSGKYKWETVRHKVRESYPYCDESVLGW